jgi:hypothetical protein
MAGSNIGRWLQVPLDERIIDPKSSRAFDTVSTKTLVFRRGNKATPLPIFSLGSSCKPTSGPIEITSEVKRKLPLARHQGPGAFDIQVEHGIYPFRQSLRAEAPYPDTQMRQRLRSKLDARRNTFSEQAMTRYAGTAGHDLR